MRQPRLWTLMLASAISTVAVAQATPAAGGKGFPYVAETAAAARQQGVVAVGTLKWTCSGTRCAITGPWAAPTVSECKSLAGAVGAIRSFGRERGAQLGATQLAECNAGLVVTLPRTTPAPRIPASGNVTATSSGGRTEILRNRAGVRFTPPSPSAIASARKIAFLLEQGVRLRPENLEPSIWLTPQRPFIDARTNVETHLYGVAGITSYDSTDAMPFGSIQMTGALRDRVGSFFALNFRSSPSRYYLTECYVAGMREYGLMAEGTRWAEARNGRVSFVVAPSLSASRVVSLWGTGGTENFWTFGGCEITPFMP